MNNTIDWDEVRNNAAISFMSSIIETTKHSVLETEAVKDVYAVAAIQYADALVERLIERRGKKFKFHEEPVGI